PLKRRAIFIRPAVAGLDLLLNEQSHLAGRVFLSLWKSRTDTKLQAPKSLLAGNGPQCFRLSGRCNPLHHLLNVIKLPPALGEAGLLTWSPIGVQVACIEQDVVGSIESKGTEIRITILRSHRLEQGTQLDFVTFVFPGIVDHRRGLIPIAGR